MHPDEVAEDAHLDPRDAGLRGRDRRHGAVRAFRAGFAVGEVRDRRAGGDGAGPACPGHVLRERSRHARPVRIGAVAAASRRRGAYGGEAGAVRRGQRRHGVRVRESRHGRRVPYRQRQRGEPHCRAACPCGDGWRERGHGAVSGRAHGQQHDRRLRALRVLRRHAGHRAQSPAAQRHGGAVLSVVLQRQRLLIRCEHRRRRGHALAAPQQQPHVLEHLRHRGLRGQRRGGRRVVPGRARAERAWRGAVLVPWRRLRVLLHAARRHGRLGCGVHHSQRRGYGAGERHHQRHVAAVPRHHRGFGHRAGGVLAGQPRTSARDRAYGVLRRPDRAVQCRQVCARGR